MKYYKLIYELVPTINLYKTENSMGRKILIKDIIILKNKFWQIFTNVIPLYFSRVFIMQL